jgi:hypothetical protein
MSRGGSDIVSSVAPSPSLAMLASVAVGYPFPPMRFDWVVQTKAHLQMMNC